MEQLIADHGIEWRCGQGCVVQIDTCTSFALDEAGAVVTEIDAEKFELAQVVHMRVMHGLEAAPDPF